MDEGGSESSHAEFQEALKTTLSFLQTDQVILSTNLLFKLDVSLPLVTGELLRKTIGVNSVTYKL